MADDIIKPIYGDVWANTGEKLAPDSAKIATGWIQEMMPYQYENFLQNRADTAITYLLQKGVAEWSSDQEYIANKSVVTYGGQLYMATATTTNVLPTVTASWKKLSVPFGVNGAIPVSFGGTGATTAVDARTNLGIGSAATANLPAGNGMLVKLTDNTLVARSVAGTAGYITVTNGDGVAGNLTINVGANVAKTDADAAWTTTSSIRLPSGSTAQRGTGAPGRIRFNLETGIYEGYDNVGWNPIGGVGTLDVQNFQGDGVRTTFTLSSTPRAENNTQVYFNGVYQQKNTYNLVGNDLVFDEAPASDISIEVVNVSSVPIGTTTAAQTSIIDSGNYYNSSNVEGALQYVGETLSNAILTFPDYAAASAAAATLPDGQVVSAVVNDATLNYSVYGNELVPETVRKGDGQINVRKFISSQIDGVTSNQVGIVAAVAAAFASGSDLMWPAGTYISDSDIPYFHNVRHIGPGVIKRGSVLYAVDPSPSTSLNLYVSPAGSDTSDGLSEDHPLATLQAACNVIQNARTNNGRWRVNIAQGTYSDGCSLENFRNRDYRVRFIGPSVALNATPLATIDGSGALAKNYGFNFANCGDVEIRDVKLINFNKNLESSSAVLAANTRLLRLHNVHADNCGIGWSMRSFTFYFVTGGSISNCRYGVLELFHVVRNFETVSDLASGTSIKNCVYGIFSKEHCTGHLDWTTIEDNTYGIYFSRSCTANASDCRVWRNAFGVNLRNGSFLVPNRIDWGTGTSNRNVKPFIKDGTSNFVTNEGTTQAGGALAQGEATMATYSPETPLSHTGTTTATTLLQLGSIQPGALVQPGVYARGVVLGRKSGSAGAVTLEMRIGSVAGASITIPASATVFKAEFWIISQGQDKQLAFATLVSDTNAPANAGRNVRTVAVESLGASFSLRSTLASASDTLIVDAAFSYTTDVAGPVEPSAA